MINGVTDATAHPTRVPDAMQAAYFRNVLSVMRGEAEAAVLSVRSRMYACEAAGDQMASQRLRHEIRGHEYELSQLDWLISRLDRRYAALWPDLVGGSVFGGIQGDNLWVGVRRWR